MKEHFGHLAAVFALCLAACGGEATKPGFEKVTFSTTLWLSAAVGHIAEERGFFEEEGLDVEFILWQRNGAALPALSQGDIDVSTTGPLNPRYFNLIQRGGAMRLVAARAVHASDDCAYAALVGRSELLASGRLDDPASLKGLRVSTERTSSNYYTWDVLLRSVGLSFDDVELVEVPSTAKPDAFAQGRLDVSTASEPWVTRLRRTGGAQVWRKVADVFPDRQSTFLIFGKRLLEERRDLGVKFVRAYQRAARVYIEEGKSERNLKTVVDRMKYDIGELREMCWPPWSRDGRIDRRTLEDYQVWALEQGLIDEIVPFEQLVDEEFLLEAERLDPGVG